jgi:hypothetical protein
MRVKRRLSVGLGVGLHFTALANTLISISYFEPNGALAGVELTLYDIENK